MKTPRLDVSRALSVEYHRTETWMLLCSDCLGKLAGRGERKEREKVVYSRGKLKPTFIVANNPTSRAGVIAFGRGRCRTPAGELALHPGDCFVIEGGCQHSFHTDTDSLGVIAYHPDSDTGPAHEDHPMVNRTYVGTVSARHLAEIRT